MALSSKRLSLFEIDPRPFQATLDQATANLEQAKANLQRAQAQLGKTELDVARYTPLAKESAISQQELDDAVQAICRQGSGGTRKAAIESARAVVESATLDLSFAKIISPIDGVAAIATARSVTSLTHPASPDDSVNDQSDSGEFHGKRTEYLNAMKQAAALGNDEHAIE